MRTPLKTEQENHVARIAMMRKRLVIEHGYLDGKDELTPSETRVKDLLNMAIDWLNM